MYGRIYRRGIWGGEARRAHRRRCGGDTPLSRCRGWRLQGAKPPAVGLSGSSACPTTVARARPTGSAAPQPARSLDPRPHLLLSAPLLPQRPSGTPRLPPLPRPPPLPLPPLLPLPPTPLPLPPVQQPPSSGRLGAPAAAPVCPVCSYAPATPALPGRMTSPLLPRPRCPPGLLDASRSAAGARSNYGPLPPHVHVAHRPPGTHKNILNHDRILRKEQARTLVRHARANEGAKDKG